MRTIILASTSPRRKELLQKTSLRFKVEASGYRENMPSKLVPRALAKKLSLGKALAVAQHHENAIIIGADTLVELNGKLLGKPRTEQHARAMLRAVSGKTLSVTTGFTIIDTKTHKKVSRAVESKVWVKQLSPTEIGAYLKTKEPLDKAGAFAVQGIGSIFIKKIEGDFFGAMGLPLYALAEELKRFGVSVLKN